MTEKQQTAAAKAFSRRWSGHGYEKGETQSFWSDLLRTVFDSEKAGVTIEYEKPIKKGKGETQYIDAYIPATKVLIEQKGAGIELSRHQQRKNQIPITPYGQAKQYADNLPYSEKPRWIITCNFREIWVYDMDMVLPQPEKIMLSDLGTEWHRLRFLTDTGRGMQSKEVRVSIKAGQLVGEIYDALLKQYAIPSDESLRWLNILCVRLVFCLYAEDAGIFRRDLFHDYLANCATSDLRGAIIDLFKTLNTPEHQRSPYLNQNLAAFPYTNGGLFAEEIEVPQFTDEIKSLLIKHASDDFDWSEISPTIFGAVFESTLNPDTRRSGGMHYTSIENIHKVIDPLFLDSLRNDLNKALSAKEKRSDKLRAFQQRLASLTFLDPACGSGNFLTETYLSLRRLENQAIRALYGEGILGSVHNPVKVSIGQFFGIEINDFAVTVATTALWISEAQMLAETEKIVQHDIDFLPLKSYTNIHEGNALRMDWDTLSPSMPDNLIYTDKLNIYQTNDDETTIMVSEPPSPYGSVHKELNVIAHQVEYHNINELHRHPVAPIAYDYIMGNPPFVGARMMSEGQKSDVVSVFGPHWKNVGNLDYVCCWYKKASDLMLANPGTRTALVSTNSITQGEQVANLWQPLLQHGLHIDFAYRTFRWDSESSLKAHVHCVIVGFSHSNTRPRIIFDGDSRTEASNINAYLIDAPNIYVGSRQHPLCDVPPLLTGSQRIDNDLFMFTDKEKDAFIKREPLSSKFFHRWYGADEFINNRPRWVLYLGNTTPAELHAMPHCRKLLQQVKEYRMASGRKQTQKAALTPNKFGLEVIPKENYMIVPVVSSERRLYVPMGFMSPEVMCSNQVNLIPDATLYHFGVLESSVHMAWMRAVCGRLEMRYRYSKDIVYNNFPWPEPTEEQKARIGQTAQAILDARALYPDSSLAALYDDLTMPSELRKAHQDNDRAVMQAYGFDPKSTSESQCIATLFKLYQEHSNG